MIGIESGGQPAGLEMHLRGLMLFPDRISTLLMSAAELIRADGRNPFTSQKPEVTDDLLIFELVSREDCSLLLCALRRLKELGEVL